MGRFLRLLLSAYVAFWSHAAATKLRPFSGGSGFDLILDLTAALMTLNPKPLHPQTLNPYTPYYTPKPLNPNLYIPKAL